EAATSCSATTARCRAILAVGAWFRTRTSSAESISGTGRRIELASPSRRGSAQVPSQGLVFAFGSAELGPAVSGILKTIEGCGHGTGKVASARRLRRRGDPDRLRDRDDRDRD